MDDSETTLIDREKQTKDDGNCVKIHPEELLSNNNNENPQHFENIYNSSSEQNCNDGEDLIVADFDPNAVVNDLAKPNEPDTRDNVSKSKSKTPKKRSKKKKNQWVLKFNCARLKSGSSSSGCSEPEIPDKDKSDSCTCTGYRRTENATPAKSDDVSVPISIPKCNFEQPEKRQRRKSQSVDLDEGEPSRRVDTETSSISALVVEPVIDLSKFNPEDYPIEDCDERARLERAREIAEGVDPPPGFSPKQIELVPQSELNMDNLKALFHSALSLSALSQIDVPKSVHSQVDYIHCLVPDLLQITSCSFYWGKMDRYEAERLLENKPEGTFLLRDSAQDDYLFSVSFRKYGRSLHARIEQWNHRFSFDSHDPGVFASPTVYGLIEHYKDPSCCMFFEPMLTIPLHRNFPFSLQHLCRAVICDHLKYDSITFLKLPKTLKTYLKEYHYRQRVRVRKFDSEP